ncbi:MAG: prolipoprotein diacylglyceryl transferase [Chloroflexota bacterium]
MNGIIISIDPVIFKLGGFEVVWHDLMALLGMAIVIPIYTYRLKKRGFKSYDFLAFYPWVVIAAFIGARLFHVVDQWQLYSNNTLAVLQFWEEGGLATWGALIGGAIATIIFAKLKRWPLGRLGDALVPALLVGQILARVGCLINGDAYGAPTDLPWAFIYTNSNAVMPANLIGVPTHPYPVYEILWNLVGLLLVWRLERFLHNDWLLFIGYLAWYSVARFVLSFVREERIWFWGLQEAQVLAIVFLAVSAVLLIHRLRQHT